MAMTIQLRGNGRSKVAAIAGEIGTPHREER